MLVSNTVFEEQFHFCFKHIGLKMQNLEPESAWDHPKLCELRQKLSKCPEMWNVISYPDVEMRDKLLGHHNYRTWTVEGRIPRFDVQGNAWDMHVVRPIVWLIVNSSLSNGVKKLTLPANHEELCRALVVYFQGKGLTHLVHRKSQIIKIMF